MNNHELPKIEEMGKGFYLNNNLPKTEMGEEYYLANNSVQVTRSKSEFIYDLVVALSTGANVEKMSVSSITARANHLFDKMTEEGIILKVN